MDGLVLGRVNGGRAFAADPCAVAAKCHGARHAGDETDGKSGEEIERSAVVHVDSLARLVVRRDRHHVSQSG